MRPCHAAAIAAITIRRSRLRILWPTLPERGRQKHAAAALHVDVSTVRRDLRAMEKEGWKS